VLILAQNAPIGSWACLTALWPGPRATRRRDLSRRLHHRPPDL